MLHQSSQSAAGVLGIRTLRISDSTITDVRKIPDLERYVALAELVDDDGVRYQPVSRDERAREGQRGRPSSRASGARDMTIGARLARVLGLYDLGDPVVSRSARSRPGHASAL
jgi:hypothetical protein